MCGPETSSLIAVAKGDWTGATSRCERRLWVASIVHSSLLARVAVAWNSRPYSRLLTPGEEIISTEDGQLSSIRDAEESSASRRGVGLVVLPVLLVVVLRYDAGVTKGGATGRRCVVGVFIV